MREKLSWYSYFSLFNKMCEYKATYYILDGSKKQYECPHPKWGPSNSNGKSYCIFHNKLNDKDVALFFAEFQKLFKSGLHDFTGFLFPKELNFKKSWGTTGSSTFLDPSFWGSEFLCKADFSNAEFHSNHSTDFSYVKFSGKSGADFSNTKFFGKGNVAFKSAQFIGEEKTTFIGAYFTIKGKVDFSNAKFLGDNGVDFSYISFLGIGQLDFSNAQFSGKGETFFSNLKFSRTGKVRFQGKTFIRKTKAIFENIIFDCPEKITFKGVDLNHCSFSGIDLSKMNFINCIFDKNLPNSEFFLNKKSVSNNTIYSDFSIDKEFKQSNIKFNLSKDDLTKKGIKRKGVSTYSKRDLLLNDPIEKFIYGTKERDALQKLGVKTIEEFRHFDAIRVFELEGYGKTTYNNILEKKLELLIVFKNEPFLNKQVESSPKSFELNKQVDLSLKSSKIYKALGTRTINILQQLNVKTANDLIKLNLEDVQLLRNCGRKTLHEISELIEQINPNPKTGLNLDALNSTHKLMFYEKPVEIETLLQFPLFTSYSHTFSNVANISSSDLHESYLPNYPLSDCILSVRATNVLEKLNIDTIGKLLLTPVKSLLNQQNSGRKTINEIQETIKSTILDDKDTSCKQIDFSSFNSMFQEFVNIVIARKRDRYIFLRRFGPYGNSPSTYDEISKDCSITRERVRQILLKESKKIEKPANLKFLKPFWITLKEIVQNNGGIVDFHTISDELQKQFNWTKRPNFRALSYLLSLSSTLIIDEELELVSIPNVPCKSCSELISKLNSLFQDGTTEMHILDINYHLSKLCKEACSYNSSIHESFNKTFIKTIIQNTKGFVVEDEKVLTIESWKFRYGRSKKDMVYIALKEIGKPIHYSELAEFIRNRNEKYKDITDRNVHTCLTGYDDFKVAGRGTYGLSSWNIKPYKTHAEAIVDLLEDYGEPMRGSRIISILSRDGDYKESNLQAALYTHPEIVRVGDNTYDLQNRIEEKTIARKASDLEIVIDDDITDIKSKQIANYQSEPEYSKVQNDTILEKSNTFKKNELLTITDSSVDYSANVEEIGIDSINKLINLATKNLNTSYKPVLLLSILNCRDNSGSCSLDNVARDFYSFYKKRKKKGFTIESPTTSIYRFIFDENEFDLKTLKQILFVSPLRVFRESGFFSYSENKIIPNKDVSKILFSKGQVSTLRVEALKAIQNYYESLREE